MSEEWRAVPGYEGWYDISDQGRVRSWRGPGKAPRRQTPYILKPFPQKRGGYPAVKLTGENCHKTLNVHTLVLTTFIGPRPDALEACHKNGNPTDNRAANLYWGTRSDNMQDMLRHGTYAKTRPTNRGASHPMASALTDDDILAIRGAYRRGSSSHDRGNAIVLAQKYNVSYGVINRIIARKTWKHV